MESYRAAKQEPGSDPTRLRLEPVPDPLNPRVSGTTAVARTSSVKFLRPECWAALIKPAPGVQIPDNLEWVFYERDRKPDEIHYGGQFPHLELILEATNDPVMDYVAREDRDPSDPDKETWFALTDWETGENGEGDTRAILVTPMVVRSVVRSRSAPKETKSIPPTVTKSYAEQKIVLGQAFGTKKARKAIDDRAMNELRPTSITDDINSLTERLDAASKATLDAIKLVTSTMATHKELQDAADAARPVPKANLEATEIADVYDPNVFIGAGVLKAIPILDWQEALQRHESIDSISQFVARRVERVGRQAEPTEKLRLLRYLHFVIRFYSIAKNGKRNTKIIPQKDVLVQSLAPAPPAVIENIRRKFSVDGVIDEFRTQLLMTHCCTIAVIIDNFETDIENLRGDLGLDDKAIRKYFGEIGARVMRQKQDGKNHIIAKLALPLQLRQQGRGVPPKRR